MELESPTGSLGRNQLTFVCFFQIIHWDSSIDSKGEKKSIPPIKTKVSTFQADPVKAFGSCGSLAKNDAHRSIGSGPIRGCGLVRVGVVLLEECVTGGWALFRSSRQA